MSCIIHESENAVRSLVVDRPVLLGLPADYTRDAVDKYIREHDPTDPLNPRYLFCTINPNPKLLHTVMRHRRKRKMKYESLPLRLQYCYCLRIIKQCYYPYLSAGAAIVGCAEKTESGNIHLHFLIYDPDIDDDYKLAQIRKLISLEPLVHVNKKNCHDRDWMNSIVILTRSLDEILTYMNKDYPKNVKVRCFNFYLLPHECEIRTKLIPSSEDIEKIYEPLI